MSLAQEAAAFLQGEVGKVLAIPATLQEAQSELQAVVAKAANADSVGRAQALAATITQLQGRATTVQANVMALAPKLNQSAVAALSFDQALDLAGQLASTTGDVVSLLSDTTDATNQAHALYYGTPGVASGAVPGWTWIVAAGVAGWYILTQKRRR